MGKYTTALIATLALTATTLAPIAQASAQDWGNRQYRDGGGAWGGAWGDDGWNNERGGRRHYNRHGKRHHKHGHKNRPIARQDNNDDALVLGVLGLAAGALITGALLSNPPARRNYREIPAPGYAPQAPGAGSDYYPPAPGPTYTQAQNLEPWSDGWYRYCAQKYRSFKPATGTFRGYDGLDHFCVPR